MLSLLAVLCFGAAGTALATNYYVSPSGSDSNPGTLAAPWATPQHAANVVGPGSTVYLETGSYAPFNINVSGSASGGFITFTNYPGETATIDGTGFTPYYIAGIIGITSQSYIIISGLDIGNDIDAASGSWPVGITVAGTDSHIQILNNTIHDITTVQGSSDWDEGIEVASGGWEYTGEIDNVIINGNTLYNAPGQGWGQTITIAGNVHNFEVTNNLIHDCDGEGIDLMDTGDIMGSPNNLHAHNGLVAGNTLYNVSALINGNSTVWPDSNPIYVDGGSNIVIEDNLIYDCDDGVSIDNEIGGGHEAAYITVRDNVIHDCLMGGIDMGGSSPATNGGEFDCTVVNNTLYNNLNGADWQWTHNGEITFSYQCSGNIVENNVIYSGSENTFVTVSNSNASSVGTIDYNDYYSTGGAASSEWEWYTQSSDATGFSNWQKTSGEDAHSVFANPMFDSLTAPNFDIASGSAAIGKGNDNLGPADFGFLDFAGNPRTIGGAIDMGAYEPNFTGGGTGNPTTNISVFGIYGFTPWYVTPATVTLTTIAGKDPVSATYYTIDGGSQQSYTAPFAINSEGIHTVRYWSVDTAGDTETAHSQQIEIDTTPPVTTASASGTTITLSATDATSGIAQTFYTVNGGSQQAYTGPFSAVGAIDYWSYDNAGNFEDAHTLGIEGPYGGTPAAIPGTIDFDNFDLGGQGVAYNSDNNTTGGAYRPTETLYTEVCSDTGYGNGYDVGYASTGQWMNYTVDAAGAGTYNLSIRSAGYGGTIHIQDSKGNNLTGPIALPWTYGWQTWTTTTASITLTAAGAQVLTVYVDSGGSSLNDMTLSVSRLPSTTAKFTGTAGNSPWYVSNVNAGLTPTAGTLPVEYTYFTLDGGAAQDYAAPFAISGDAVHALTYWSVDIAGDAEAANTQTISIDTTPPVTAIAVAGSTDTSGNYVNTVTATLTATDNVSGVASTYYTLDGGSKQTYNVPVAVSAVGAHTIKFHSVDVAGNIESAHSQSFTIDLLKPRSLSLSPSIVMGGATSTGTITLTGPAPAGGLAVTVTSSNSAVASTSGGAVAVQAGNRSGSFIVRTFPVSATKTAKISAVANGITETATLTVTAPAITSVAVSPAALVGGATSAATVTLSKAVAADTPVIVKSNNPVATPIGTVIVPAGRSSATFSVDTAAVLSKCTVVVAAKANGVTRTAVLTVKPAAVASLTVSPGAVLGGGSSTGTVALDGPAATGTTVILSSNSAAVSMPQSLAIPAGAASATFSIATTAVAAKTVATVKATCGGKSKIATLTIKH
jgi:hypothetical protein